MRTVALIVAAGKGERAGGALPKQYAPLAGRSVVAWSYDAIARHPQIGDVIVVTSDEHLGLLRNALPAARSVTGGATRRLSVQAGLAQCTDADRVLIHDAARPFVPSAVIDRLLAALDADDGAVPMLPVVDTLLRQNGETIDRSKLYRVQTPQAFRRDILEEAHRRWTGPEPTDDAQMVRATGGRVRMIEGDVMLDKITYPGDLALAESRLGHETRTATGYDVHRLSTGEDLWLGGVRIPHDRGLTGHSDADVALHAITDALLGAIAAGDIGQHFPPSDPKWKGAESGQFLRHAASLVAAAGARISFVDLTIICEAPKIGPHRDTIRSRIAELLALSLDRISVKATTTERLGFTGREEGIAALATATIRLPIA